MTIKDWVSLSEYGGFRPNFITLNKKIKICKNIHRNYDFEIFNNLVILFELIYLKCLINDDTHDWKYNVSNICVDNKNGEVYDVHILERNTSKNRGIESVLLSSPSSFSINYSLNEVSPILLIDDNYKIIHHGMPKPYYYCGYCGKYTKPHPHGN